MEKKIINTFYGNVVAVLEKKDGMVKIADGTTNGEKWVSEAEVHETTASDFYFGDDENLFKTITDNLFDTYKRKNHDYGNSFEEDLNEDGLICAKYAIGNKFRRFKTLCKQTAEVEESQLDTLLDMANYCILTAMWLKKKRVNEIEEG